MAEIKFTGDAGLFGLLSALPGRVGFLGATGGEQQTA